MHSIMIVLVASLIVYCASKPIDDEENVRTLISEFRESDHSEHSDHHIVRRSKRSGIINGHMCPIGHGKLATGDCVPCTGRSLPGCPKLEDDPDYNDV